MRKSAGFSLIEILVAATLLATVVGMVFTAFSTANRLVSANAWQAYSVAKNKLQFLKSYVKYSEWYPTANPATQYFSVGSHGSLGGIGSDPGSNYNSPYVVTDVPGRDYRRLDMSIQWPDA